METLRGYKLKSRKGLSHWDPLLEEWLLTMERYSRIMKGEDAAYWYNERSNIGVLAGAAWRCGRIALEEFQLKKGFRNREKRNGRCDLWIATEADEEYIEAKFRWIALRSVNVERIVEESLRIATLDAKRTRGNDTDTKAIALGFFPVYVSNRWTNDLDELIASAVKKVLSIDYHAVAWCFPKEVRRGIVSVNGNLRPGIILVAKNVDY